MRHGVLVWVLLQVIQRIFELNYWIHGEMFVLTSVFFINGCAVFFTQLCFQERIKFLSFQRNDISDGTQFSLKLVKDLSYLWDLLMTILLEKLVDSQESTPTYLSAVIKGFVWRACLLLVLFCTVIKYLSLGPSFYVPECETFSFALCRVWPC